MRKQRLDLRPPISAWFTKGACGLVPVLHDRGEWKLGSDGRKYLVKSELKLIYTTKMSPMEPAGKARTKNGSALAV